MSKPMRFLDNNGRSFLAVFLAFIFLLYAIVYGDSTMAPDGRYSVDPTMLLIAGAQFLFNVAALFIGYGKFVGVNAAYQKDMTRQMEEMKLEMVSFNARLSPLERAHQPPCKEMLMLENKLSDKFAVIEREIATVCATLLKEIQKG